jgi:hypothetical protein
MLNVIILSAIVLNAIKLSVMLCATKLNNNFA